jgi:hypothetical protein
MMKNPMIQCHEKNHQPRAMGEIFSWVNPWPSKNPVVMLQVCLENNETNKKTNSAIFATHLRVKPDFRKSSPH